MGEMPPWRLTLACTHRPLLNVLAIRDRLCTLEPLDMLPQVRVEYDERTAYIDFDDHYIEVTVWPFPIETDELDRSRASVRPQFADAAHSLKGHTLQVQCLYNGVHYDYCERMIALYKVAACFDLGDTLLGIWDEGLALALPPSFHRTLMNPHFLKECREVVPCGYWTNMLVFERPGGGFWFYTKGHYRFNINDFACLVEDPTQQSQVCLMLQEIFHRIRESRLPVEAGEKIQLSDTLWVRFSRLFEHEAVLGSPLGTLVVTPLVVTPFEPEE
jgi:hypothetical protein